MNITTIEKKNIINPDKKINLREAKKVKNSKNFNIKKIVPKKVGFKNVMGSINPEIKNKKIQDNDISIEEKLYDISEQLEKYEKDVNKLWKDFQ